MIGNHENRVGSLLPAIWRVGQCRHMGRRPPEGQCGRPCDCGSLVRLLARHTYGHWFFPVWNTLTLAIWFLVVVSLLASLREAIEGLEQTVARRTKALQAKNAQRRQAEEHLRHALNDVQTAHAELQRTQFQLIETAKMESVGRLAAGVAHEVKNPLMTLSLGANHFLHRKIENQDEAQLVQDMKEAVHRASSIIDVLLDYARPRPLQPA
jgi:C4-dicarboxylate-specific signal transduction histidine kinase